MTKLFDISHTVKSLQLGGNEAGKYFSLPQLEVMGVCNISTMPITIKILLESLLRNYDNKKVTLNNILQLAARGNQSISTINIPFVPTRLILQDYTGIPLLIDLATLRDYVKNKGIDPQKVSMLLPTTLVVDHSLQADITGVKNACALNEENEFINNFERYHFLKWCQQAFKNFNIITSGHGIIHQINFEHLSHPLHCENGILFPDSVIGTDSHTTMINGLGIAGWGVGGIEAEALMLGVPLNLAVPRVIAVELDGKLQGNASAMDLALSLTNKLRFSGITGCIIEFVGNGLKHLSIFDRATIANMAPEIGALMSYFSIDETTLEFLKNRGDSQQQIDTVYQYYWNQGMFCHNYRNVAYDDVIKFDVAQVKPCIAGPSQPYEKIDLNDFGTRAADIISKKCSESNIAHEELINNGDILIAAITSCLATSNPFLMVEAGLLAKKAVQKGLRTKKHVKTSFAPGSVMVSKYLQTLELQQYLDILGFNVVGYGCAVCDGNCGNLKTKYEEKILEGSVDAIAVLSGNRNFTGRIHPRIKNNFLMNPALVIVFSLVGTIKLDICNDQLGCDINNVPVFLRDIWPTEQEVNKLVDAIKWRELFAASATQLNQENKFWSSLNISVSETYCWNDKSTYIVASPFFDDTKANPLSEIKNARTLLLLGDDITTDHISPVGKIMPDTLAGQYLKEQGVEEKDFNSFGSRRGNHQVMVRGAFSNFTIRNSILTNRGREKIIQCVPKESLPIYLVAMEYAKENVPLIIFAGDRYGAGSSRDWAAKATKLLGVKAVIAKSFERIHHSNLIGMGILPCKFLNDQDAELLAISGKEKFCINIINKRLTPHQKAILTIENDDGIVNSVPIIVAIDNIAEANYVNNGGILPYLMKKIVDSRTIDSDCKTN